VKNFRDFWDKQWQVLYQTPPTPRLIKEDVEVRTGRFVRIRRSISRWLAKVAWKIWGRRRTLERMRMIALKNPPPRLSEKMISREHRRIEDYRAHLDSIPAPDLPVKLPPPDADDTGMN
jgi:hypothetical protein